MKPLLLISLVLCLCGCGKVQVPLATTNVFDFSKVPVEEPKFLRVHGTISISFRENGMDWGVSAIKDYAIALQDPATLQTDFPAGYSVEVHDGGQILLFHNCCTTNIVIRTNYTGMIEFACEPHVTKTNGGWIITFEK